MRKSAWFLLLLAMMLPTPTEAQAQNATVVSSCGTAAYTPGTVKSLTQDPNGNQCTAGTSTTQIGGWPGNSQTTGTPLSVTATSTASSLTGLGPVVVVSNTSTSVPIFCKLGASATINDLQIPPLSWMAFTVGTNTTLACLTQTGTAIANLSGGTGMPTGAGGGGGGGGTGGGGGAVTIANGADIAEGNTGDSVCTTDTGPCSLLALAKRLNQTLTALNGIAAGSIAPGSNNIGNVGLISEYPAGSVPVQNSATPGAVSLTATLPASTTLKTYICGYSIRANATNPTTGDATVTGVKDGTMHFAEWVAPAASALGVNEQIFKPCLPTAAVNTAISVTSWAPGAGGYNSVTAWGYQL
jgi:hypothetical protein